MKKVMLNCVSLLLVLSTFVYAVQLVDNNVSGAGVATHDHAAKMDFSQIAGRLYDLRALADIPYRGERSGNFSSMDRRARYNSITQEYEKWYNNDDGDGYIRKEEDGIVAAEMYGPGVIWRIWSAMPESGLMKVYIDGRPEPVLSLPFRDFFDNTKEPFNYPELVRDNAKGKNSYIPIVYQKSCKIVFCKGWGRYYQITYSTFAPDTKVPSFRGSFNDHEKSVLRKADIAWANCQPENSQVAEEKEEKTLVVEAGQQVEVARYANPGAITSLRIKMPEIANMSASSVQKDGPAVDLLRQLTMSIYWDGQDKPAVWAPLGDFFGTAPGVNKYKSLSLGMAENEFYCNWYMPFRFARITINNESKVSQRLIFNIKTERLNGSEADNLLRFHAKWHRDNYYPHTRERLMGDRWPDWMVLYTDSTKGRFCGMALHIWNPLHMWNASLRDKYKWKYPIGPLFAEGEGNHSFFKGHVLQNTNWWGEGDEKFFVDGEVMPSTFGTGSEDYFGYAWGTPARYESAVQCQTYNNDNTGHISVCRWQIADNVPFHNSFEGCIEKYYDNNWPLLYSVTAYWYQQAGTEDIYGPVPIDDRIGYYDEPELK